jgi:hypothetical protein
MAPSLKMLLPLSMSETDKPCAGGLELNVTGRAREIDHRYPDHCCPSTARSPKREACVCVCSLAASSAIPLLLLYVAAAYRAQPLPTV